MLCHASLIKFIKHAMSSTCMCVHYSVDHIAGKINVQVFIKFTSLFWMGHFCIAQYGTKWLAPVIRCDELQLHSLCSIWTGIVSPCTEVTVPPPSLVAVEVPSPSSPPRTSCQGSGTSTWSAGSPGGRWPHSSCTRWTWSKSDSQAGVLWACRYGGMSLRVAHS